MKQLLQLPPVIAEINIPAQSSHLHLQKNVVTSR